MANDRISLVMEEVTDPEELAGARAQRERFDRNAAWLQAHAEEIYSRHRGKCLCIAGEELFVADTPEEALALATAAHPEDDGSFVHYVPREKLYCARGKMVFSWERRHPACWRSRIQEIEGNCQFIPRAV
ncbi:MAG: hypothetical protein L0229_31975 [Blastocatellia bacterium]|nr:hypothetical protein [Blastocatellia bacterium]